MNMMNNLSVVKVMDEIPAPEEYEHLSRRYVDPYIISKLAKLEAKLEQYEADRKKIMAEDEEILRELKELRGDVTRMKGFVGGVAFVFTAVGVGAGLLISYFSSFPSS